MLTSDQPTTHFTPVIIALPEGFAISTNPGLHGDMQFFEVSDDHMLTVYEPSTKDDTLTYVYSGHDSDEGSVTIDYRTTCGSPADGSEGEPDGWDIEISSGSDVWGLEEHSTAIRDAIKLHKALGRDMQHRE